MPDIEAVGDAATAGVLAAAVEPRHGGETGGHTHERACLNCSTALTGDYCHACGQRAHVHRTIGAFWHDLLHGVLHFEGKIWRTLPLLAWKPGELTRRYVEGQRARYVSPIALFLFSVFLMFAAVSLIGGPFELTSPNTAESRAEANIELREARAEAQAEIAQLRKERAERVRGGRPTAEVDARIRSVAQGLAAQEAILRGVLGANEPGSPNGAADNPIVAMDTDGAPFALGWFDAAYRKAKENPSLLFYKVQNNAYKFSWALIPISVPFVSLLFLHRRRYRSFGAYDHTVFVTYSIAFMSLGLVALTLLRPLGFSDLTQLLILVVPPLHMYRQLRGAYGLSRWSAAWRTLALVIFTFLALTIFLAVLLMLGVLG
jgi:hypothetical protein